MFPKADEIGSVSLMDLSHSQDCAPFRPPMDSGPIAQADHYLYGDKCPAVISCWRELWFDGQ
jgi:hypothetical protein